MDLADVFGAENVVRLAASAVAGLDLGADAVRVLTEVGLPRIPYGSFNPEPPARDAGRVHFARTAIGYFWLDLTDGDGEVRLSPKAANAAPLYVASTLEAFV